MIKKQYTIQEHKINYLKDGDMVSWKNLLKNTVQYGLVEKIFIYNIEENIRHAVFVVVRSLQGQKYRLLIDQLNLVSKR